MKKSTTAGIIIIFAGYAVASYGYVLVRGWNVPVRAWFDPLHAYRWPGAGPGAIPAGSVFPSSATSG